MSFSPLEEVTMVPRSVDTNSGRVGREASLGEYLSCSRTGRPKEKYEKRGNKTVVSRFRISLRPALDPSFCFLLMWAMRELAPSWG